MTEETREMIGLSGLVIWVNAFWWFVAWDFHRMAKRRQSQDFAVKIMDRP